MGGPSPRTPDGRTGFFSMTGASIPTSSMEATVAGREGASASAAAIFALHRKGRVPCATPPPRIAVAWVRLSSTPGTHPTNLHRGLRR